MEESARTLAQVDYRRHQPNWTVPLRGNWPYEQAVSEDDSQSDA